MWLVIVVGLLWLLLPFIMRAFWFILGIGVLIIIASWFIHSLVWIIPLIVISIIGQHLIDKHYLNTGKWRWLASSKVKEK